MRVSSRTFLAGEIRVDIMKKFPPPAGPVKNLDFPEIPSTILEGGMEVINFEDGYLPRVSVVLGLPSGRLHDPDGKRGLTQLLSDMLKEGSENRSSRQIAAEMDRYAIDYSSHVLLEYTLLHFKFLENFIEESMDLFSDIMYKAVFPEEEWAKAAVRWKGHLASQKSNPSYLARERIYSELFPGSPLSNCSVALPTIDILEAGDFRCFYKKRFIPSSGIMGFSGPLSAGDSLALARRFMGKSGEKRLPETSVSEVAPPNRRICLVHRPGSQQAKILIGLLAPPRKSGDSMSLKLLNQVFGGGGSSRVFLNLREDKGYTYGAYSYLRQSNYAGTFMVSTNVNNSVVAASIREIFNEMDRLRQENISGEELDRCKAEINGTFLRQMETPSSICSMELTRRLVKLPQDYYHEFIPALMAVGPDQVRRAAESILNSERAVVVVVGDKDEIGADLAGLDSEMLQFEGQ